MARKPLYPELRAAPAPVPRQRKKPPREQALLSFEVESQRTSLTRPGLSPAERLAGWADEGEVDARRRARGAVYRSQPRSLAQAVEAARSRVGDQRGWAGACPAELLGLYAVLHAQVYGVAPADLDTAWPAALSAAKSLLEREFECSAERVVDFLRWVWRRERGREKQRIAAKNGGFRIGWRWQFRGRELVTEYRVDLARAAQAQTARARR